MLSHSFSLFGDFFNSLCRSAALHFDKKLIDLIKKYIKSGVMENGIVMKTKEGSPQGGNLSPLLANIYLDKFDKEFEGRGVQVIRYENNKSA